MIDALLCCSALAANLGHLTRRCCLAAGLYLCIGKAFLPGKDGSAWAIVIIWIGGHVGAFLAELVSAMTSLHIWAAWAAAHPTLQPGSCEQVMGQPMWRRGNSSADGDLERGSSGIEIVEYAAPTA